MKALLQIECDQMVKEGKGAWLYNIALQYNQLVQAKIDMTVNQFRSLFMLPPHKDERGEASILADDIEKPEDKKA